MSITVEGAGVAAVGGAGERRDDGAGKRRVAVAISDLAYEALTGSESPAAASAAVRIESALRCYLGDKGRNRAAWPYPPFLRGSETPPALQVETEVAADLWQAFEAEAAAQGVSSEQLAEHAAFYFGAERDAGRLTERILDDFSTSPADEKS